MKKMTMKHNEPGRTMVEMLGVLSIVGVLSLTAVVGITYAMRRQAVVQTVDLINKSTTGILTGKVLNTLGDDPSAPSVVSTQPIPLSAYMSDRSHASAAEKDVYGKETFVGPRGSVFSARPSALQGYGFVLAVNNMQSAVCENVLAHDLDYDAVVQVDDEGQPVGDFVDAIDLDDAQNRKVFCQSKGDKVLNVGFVFNKISPDDDGSNQPECNACTKPILGECVPKETCGGQNTDRKYLDADRCVCKCLDANADINNDCTCPSDKPVWNDVDKKCEACPNGEEWDGISKKCVSSSGRGAVVATDITTTTATPTTYVPKTTDRSSTVVSTSPVTSTLYTTTGVNTTTTGVMTTETTIPATTTTGAMTTTTTATVTPTTYVSESTDWSSTVVSTSPVTSTLYTTTGMNTITVETETPTVYEPETTGANTTIAEPETTTPLEMCDLSIYDEIYEEANKICKTYIGSELNEFLSCVNNSDAGITILSDGTQVSFTSHGIEYEANLNIQDLVCNNNMSSLVPKPKGSLSNLCCDSVQSVSNTLATAIMRLNDCANGRIKQAIYDEIQTLSYIKRKCAMLAYNKWNTEDGYIQEGISEKLQDALNKEGVCVENCIKGSPVVISTSPVTSTLYTTTGVNTTTTGAMTTTTATPTTYVSESTDWSSTEVSTSPVSSILYTTTGLNTTTTGAMTTETTIPATTTATPTTYVSETTDWSSTEVSTSPVTSTSYTTTGLNTTTTGAMTTTTATATPTTYGPESTDWSSTEVSTSPVSSTLYTTTGVDTTITDTVTSTTYEPETTVLLSTEVSTSPVTSTLYTTTGVDKYFEWEARVPVGHSSIQRFPIDSLDEALSDPDLKDHIYAIGIGGGATPLKVAILNNDLQLMRKCLDAGVNPDKGNMDGIAGLESPLAKAVNNYSNVAMEGKGPSVAREQITALLNAGANPNIPVSISLNECGRQTPLHAMAKLRDNSMIRLLVSKGADITAKDCGQIPLDVYKANLTNLDGGALEWRESENAEIIQMLTPRGWFW